MSLRETLMLRAFGLTKIPMLFFISPSVVHLDDEKCVIKVPLNRRTRNHVGSMYFGVLCAGADVASGLVAMRLTGKRATFLFKDLKAEFLKRAEGDVHFTCAEGVAVKKLVERALESGQRENLTVPVVATVPSKMGDEPVAKFELTLSIKKK